jgi:hypothetical protein
VLLARRGECKITVESVQPKFTNVPKMNFLTADADGRPALKRFSDGQ